LKNDTNQNTIMKLNDHVKQTSTRLKRLALAVVLCAAAFFGPASSAGAQTYGLTGTYTGGAVAAPWGTGINFGYEFVVSDWPIRVTWLGYYGPGGLTESHNVLLWRTDGTLLKSETIASGTSETLVGDFCGHDITPITLEPGTYRISGSFWSAADLWPGASTSNWQGYTPNISITQGCGFWHEDYPTWGDGAGDVHLSVNFGFTVLTPTPASIVTFGLPDNAAAVDQTGSTVTMYVPYGTDVTDLAPSYTLYTAGATCDHDNGTTTYDFSNPVTYKVTDGGNVRDYAVSVVVLPNDTQITWNTGNGTWDTFTSNWLGQPSGQTMPFFKGANVKFQGAGGTVTVAPNMAPDSITMTGGDYTFAGNPLVSGALTHSGPGTTTFASVPSGLSGITVNGGMVVLEANRYSGGNTFTLPEATVNSGGILRSVTAQVTGNLTMNGGEYQESSGWSGSWNGSIHLASNSTFSAVGYDSLTLNATIDGPGGLSWNGPHGEGGVLTKPNSYAGPTIVNSGTLECQDAASLGNGGDLTIATAAKVKLNYTGDHVVSSLTLGGVAMLPGSHGSSGSPALFKNDTYFSPSVSGTVTVPGEIPPLITSFGLPGHLAVIDQSARTITWMVPYGSDVTTLAPAYTLTSGTCDPASGATRNFTSAVTYTATAGALNNAYVVTVIVHPYVPAMPVTEGLVLWLDASKLTGLNDGDAVATWTDMSGLSHNATAGGSPKYIGGVLGGEPAIRFSSANGDIFRTANLSGQFPSGATLFIVTALRVTSGAYTLINTTDGNPYDEWWCYYDGNSYPAPFRSSRVNSYCQMPYSGSHVFAVSSSADWQMWIDGAGKGVAAGAFSAGGVQDIGNGSSGGGLDGDIAEVLEFNRTLSSDELNAVGHYLTAKYMLNTSYTAPVTTSYGNWASMHGLTGTAGSGTDPAFDADPNKEGVANGLVWLIGGTTGNPLANSNSILPVPTDDGGNLVLTFQCLKSSVRGTANLTVQYSKNLGTGDAWHGVPVPDSDQPDDGSGVGFVVTPIGGSDYNNVTATIAAPALGGKLFGRLMATEN